MFGHVVRRYRRRSGLTQEDVADRAGLGLRTIRDIEAGRINRPRAATVRLLADVFDLRGIERHRFHELAVFDGEAEAPDGAGLSADERTMLRSLLGRLVGDPLCPRCAAVDRS